jgi:UDPglucose 6-dehydrogenase
MAEEKGRHPQLLRAVMEINDDRRRLAVKRLRELVGDLQGTTIGLLGLSFKPNTDDMRDAPSVTIADLLTQMGAQVRAYDPVAMSVARQILPNVEMCTDPYELATGCDALMVITDWNEFKQLDLERIKNLMKRPILVDGRNIYDPKTMKQIGFRYRGLGRGYNDE